MDTESPPECEQSSPRQPPRAANKHVLEVVHVLAIEASIMQMPKRSSRLILALGAVILAALYFGIPRLLAGASVLFSLLYGASMALSSIWWLVHSERRSEELAEHLRSSRIAEAIASGPLELAKIYDYAPWPWSLVILGYRPKNLRGWVRLVARNLDWYLAEPRLLIRLEWVAYILCWLVYVTFALQSIVAPFAAHNVWNMMMIALVILLPSGFLWGVVEHRRMLGAMLLRDHLRERFAEDLKAAEEAD